MTTQTNRLSNGPQAVTVAKPKTIRQQLESDSFREAVAKALPKHLTPDRFIRVACTTVMRTPKLATCDQTSFFNALLTLSQLGIEADGRRAHLIPFQNRKRNVTEVQLIIDYKGLAELAMRSGVVSVLHADVICENDEFDYDAGQLKRHRIDFRKPRGNVYAAYALCRFKDGGEKCEVMTFEDIEEIRKRSRAGNDGPWVTDWNEMAKKTVFRRLSKWLPLSPEFRDAVDADDEPIAASPEAAPVSLVQVANSAFELPEQATAELAPEDDNVDMGPPKPEPANETTSPNTVQQNLAKEVEAAGCTFNDFQKWADQTGSLADATSYGSFEDVPTEACKRILRAFRGEKSRPIVMQQLATVAAKT